MESNCKFNICIDQKVSISVRTTYLSVKGRIFKAIICNAKYFIKRDHSSMLYFNSKTGLLPTFSGVSLFGTTTFILVESYTLRNEASIL